MKPISSSHAARYPKLIFVFAAILSLPAIGYVVLAAPPASTDRPAPAAPLNSPVPTPAPVVEAVIPNTGSETASTPVLIAGGYFGYPPYLFVGQQRVRGLVQISSTLLSAVLPTGLPVGAQTVKVCNPDLQCGSLPNGFTVMAAGPSLQGNAPRQGLNDTPNEVELWGGNFKPGLAITLGHTALNEVVWVDSRHVVVVVPAGFPSGAYDIDVQNPDAPLVSRLVNAYVSISPSDHDLYVDDDDIWTSPIAVRQDGGPVRLGVNVHRQGGTGTLAPVDVAFYAGDPAAGGVLLGRGTTPPMEPRSDAVEAASIEWDPSAYLGRLDIQVIVDPDQQVDELTRVDNTAHFTIAILPPASDEDPPVLQSLAVNDGADLTTQRDITVSLSATDGDGSGVRSMYLVEREFIAAARQWVVIQATGWLPFHSSFTMTLSSQGGLRYIQGWVADSAGNISEQTAMQPINYLPPIDRVRLNQVRLYRRWYAAGQAVSLTLETFDGDADVYVWRPDGLQAWFSDNPGLEPDPVSFAAPWAGYYLIEVYGYQDSHYRLSFAEVTARIAARIAARTAARTAARAAANPVQAPADKQPRTSPIVAPDDQPMGALAVPAAPHPPRAYFPAMWVAADAAYNQSFLPIARLLDTPRPFAAFMPVVFR